MATLDATINALKKGLTEITVNAAVKNIEGWESKLEGQDGLKTIHNDLGKLKDLLQADELDGKSIGKLLHKLGTETTKAASKADGDDKSKIQELGELLTKGAEQLDDTKATAK